MPAATSAVSHVAVPWLTVKLPLGRASPTGLREENRPSVEALNYWATGLTAVAAAGLVIVSVTGTESVWPALVIAIVP